MQLGWLSYDIGIATVCCAATKKTPVCNLNEESINEGPGTFVESVRPFIRYCSRWRSSDRDRNAPNGAKGLLVLSSKKELHPDCSPATERLHILLLPGKIRSNAFAGSASPASATKSYRRRLARRCDLPLNFHPAAIRVSADVTALGRGE